MDGSPRIYRAMPRKGARYTSAQWKSMKDIIRQLYTDEKKKLSCVIKILRERFNFTPTMKQLKDRLRKWGFKKNIPDYIMKNIAWTALMRKREGKRSNFLYEGRAVLEEKVAVYLKRNGFSDEYLDSMAYSVEGATPPFIVFTPPASPDMSLQARNSIQDILQDLQSHTHQSVAFAIGPGDPDVAPLSLDISHSNWQSVQALPAGEPYSAVITSHDNRLALRGGTILNFLPRSIENRPESPENLLGCFQEQICPFLSVTDGKHNLWQELVLPLIVNSQTKPQSQTLRHSISAVTALHISKDWELHRYGRGLLSHSHDALLQEVRAEKPSITTLATILILAFWIRWDEGLQFGKEHIIGAISFLRNALSQYDALGLSPDFSYYLFAFLYDTCYRMDSLSRLVRSALGTDQSQSVILPPFDEVCPAYIVRHQDEEPRVDPWMGYVRVLYPLIGRAADFCNRVRVASSNSLSIITEAESLRNEIREWRPDERILDSPNGYPIDMKLKKDIKNMAEAYRYATLLYLHQVVPETFGNSTHELAQKIFAYLKAMPPNSRTTIVQTYPLFVAGCEACSAKDREWVKERWTTMMARMNFTNIDSCLKITQEVWRKRDIYRVERQKLSIQPGFEYFGDIDGKLDPQFTFQGVLHWASAMKHLDFQVAW